MTVHGKGPQFQTQTTYDCTFFLKTTRSRLASTGLSICKHRHLGILFTWQHRCLWEPDVTTLVAFTTSFIISMFISWIMLTWRSLSSVRFTFWMGPMGVGWGPLHCNHPRRIVPNLCRYQRLRPGESMPLHTGSFHHSLLTTMDKTHRFIQSVGKQTFGTSHNHT